MTTTDSRTVFVGEVLDRNQGWGVVQSASHPDWKCPDCGGKEVVRGLDGGLSSMFSCSCGSEFVQYPGRVER